MRPRLIHVEGRKGLTCLKPQGLVFIPYPHQAPERMYSAVTERANLETLTCRLFVFHPLQERHESLNRTTQVPITTMEGFCERDLVASRDKSRPRV